jgi:hypothetical protein
MATRKKPESKIMATRKKPESKIMATRKKPESKIMATRKKPESKSASSSTSAVAEYRRKTRKEGGKIVYATVGPEAAKALDAIMVHRVCKMREALDYSLQRTAKDLLRVR